MKRRNIKLLALSALFLLAIGFSSNALARAETVEDYALFETQEYVTEQAEGEKTLLEMAKEFIAPIIAGASTGLVIVLPLAFMCIRYSLRLKAQNGGFETLKRMNKELESKLKDATDIDYKGEFKDVASVVIGDFMVNFGEKFGTVENRIAEVLAEQKTDRDMLQKIESAMLAAWGGNQSIREILSKPSAPSALKKEVMINERLKELVTSIKGDEAGRLILEVEQSIEEGA